MTPENKYKMQFNLEKENVLSVAYSMRFITWTRKIPIEIKNYHREFWGMKPLQQKNKVIVYC